MTFLDVSPCWNDQRMSKERSRLGVEVMDGNLEVKMAVRTKSAGVCA